jgi:hypothetical protein
MNFERGNTVTETLKIGRFANAISIKDFYVHGRITYPGISGIRVFIENDAAVFPSVTKSFNFGLSGEALIKGLEILESGGICREFDDYIHSLIPKYWFQSNKMRGISLPYQEYEITSQLQHIYINKNLTLAFSLTGKDLLYKEKLYRIAKPRNGDENTDI